MNAPRLFFGVSLLTAILMGAGWIAVVCTAVFLPGGHPPLSAYVGIAVVFASWILGTIGVVAGLVSLKRSKTRGAALIVVVANTTLLAFSVLVNFL